MNIHLSVIGSTGKIGRVLVPTLLRTFSMDLASVLLPAPLGKSVSNKLSALERQCAAIESRIPVRACTFDEARDAHLTLFLADDPINKAYIARRGACSQPVSRFRLGKNNIPLIDEYGEAFQGYHGQILMVTNHVDLLCTLLAVRSGISPYKITGLSWNDTLRLHSVLPSVFSVLGNPQNVVMVGTHDEYAVVSTLPDATLGAVRLAEHAHTNTILEQGILEKMTKARAVAEMTSLQDTSNVTIRSIEEHIAFLLGKSTHKDFVYSHPFQRIEEDIPVFVGMDAQGHYWDCLPEAKRKTVREGVRRVVQEVRIQKSIPEKINFYWTDMRSLPFARMYLSWIDRQYVRCPAKFYFEVSRMTDYMIKDEIISVLCEGFSHDSAQLATLFKQYVLLHEQLCSVALLVQRYARLYEYAEKASLNTHEDPQTVLAQLHWCLQVLPATQDLYRDTATDTENPKDTLKKDIETLCTEIERLNAALPPQLERVKESAIPLRHALQAYMNDTGKTDPFITALYADIVLIGGDIAEASRLATQALETSPSHYGAMVVNKTALAQGRNEEPYNAITLHQLLPEQTDVPDERRISAGNLFYQITYRASEYYYKWLGKTIPLFLDSI